MMEDIGKLTRKKIMSLFIDEDPTVSQILLENPRIDTQLRRLFPPTTLNDCWVYKGSKRTEYPVGKVKVRGRRRTIRWSRLICFMRDETIADGCEVAHTCQNRNCGNPNHLVAWPRSFHAEMDSHYRATKKALEAAGYAFRLNVGRFDLSDANPLDEQSNLEIAKDLCETLSIPMGLATRLVQNDAKIATLVEENCQQFPKLRRVLQERRSS